MWCWLVQVWWGVGLFFPKYRGGVWGAVAILVTP